MYIYIYTYIYFEPLPLEPLIWDPGTPGPLRPGMSPVTAGGRLSLQLNSVGGLGAARVFFKRFFCLRTGKNQL